MSKNRVAVPFSQSEVHDFEARLPVLQAESELWQRVLLRVLGRPNVPVGLGALSAPPTSVPQLVNVLAGVGLRVIEEMEVDLEYERWANEVSAMPRAFDLEGALREQVLRSDQVRS
jgi:hypothetical protein